MNNPEPNKLSATNKTKVKIRFSNLLGWAGLTLMLSGIFYVIVGLFHPLNELQSVTTTSWEIVHIFALASSFLGLLGLTGLYIRQSAKAGWVGFVGYVFFILWFALILGLTFVETFILPKLAGISPDFVDAFLGIFNGSASDINLGVLPVLWALTGPLYIFGGLLLGIATFRARILPRWAGVLLAAGTTLGPIAAIFPPELQPKVAVPVGLALAWLGFALWAEQSKNKPLNS